MGVLIEREQILMAHMRRTLDLFEAMSAYAEFVDLEEVIAMTDSWNSHVILLPLLVHCTTPGVHYHGMLERLIFCASMYIVISEPSDIPYLKQINKRREY